MPDVYTTTSSVNYVQTAYDRLAYFALRPELFFDNAADVRPTNQSMPGSSVTFTIQNDLAIASTALNESTDVSAVALSTSTVNITLSEYGNAVITTAALRGEAFVEIDPVLANTIGYNAGVSIDEVARIALQAGSNVDYAAGTTAGSGAAAQPPAARNQITPNDTFRGYDVAFERSRLVTNNAPGFGGFYIGYIHPDVAFDLMADTGGLNWRDPHKYSQPDEIWTGEIGAFQGVRFIETPRAPVFADAGSSTTDTDVYATLFLGRQALGKVWSMIDGNGPRPVVVPGPVTDHLRRFVPMGWKWLGGYAIFRQACLRRVESASSIGDNTTAGTAHIPSIDL